MKTLVLIGCLGCVAIWSGCNSAASKSEGAMAKVEGDRIQIPENSPQRTALMTEVAEPCKNSNLRLNGRLVWDDNVTVRIFTPFGGRVSEILAEAGQLVQKDEPLALIGSADYGQMQADARKTATDFLLAERTFNRLRELHDHGAASLKDLQSAEADYARAVSEKERTLGRLLMYGGTTNALEQVYRLKSPLRGVVVEKNINPGQEVRSDQMLGNLEKIAAPLFVVTDPSRLWIQLDATEQDLPHLRPGQPLVIHVAAYPKRNYRGTIELISDYLDPTTRTIKVRGSVPNADRLLKSEMFVSVDILGDSRQGLEVSSKAVFLDGEKHYVILEENPGRYARRHVETGPEHNGKVLILDGIQPGQRVVTEGSLLLKQMLESAQGS